MNLTTLLLFYIISKGYSISFTQSSVREETMRLTIEGHGLRIAKTITKDELTKSRSNNSLICEIIYDLFCELERSQASREGS